MKKILSIGLGIMAICLFFLPSSVKADKIKVVTTTDFYGQVAEEVLGNKGKVTSIINNPSIDPHDYEPTTRTAKQVADANIVIYNGLGYDSWITKLSHDKKKINVAANVMHAKDGANEHLWYNSKTMGKLADYLVKEYTKIDPKNEAYYKKNTAKYKQKLTKLQTLIAKIKKNSDNKKVAVSEPVFDYALKDMGYKISNSHFAKATEDGSDPSYSDIKKLQNDIKHKKIAFFVENTQSDSKVISGIVDLCKKYDVPVVKVTETSPKGKDYLQWMSSEYKQVLKIQEDGK
ncbi:metal ABC transporter solute-binding protein [Ligilactobacillus salivarius]|uniref:metal ABC transporter solute-binding protein n=1 Tax=Ligilactobacillus salivarius TaxID=1624 RepID=UPI0022E31717|nr:metal ABC transporter solute-binding protein [Ligilactobacillus salivarius]